MKKSVFVCFAILFGHLNGYGQSCLPAGITFTSQTEINNFKINYPGCKIVGQITIDGTSIYNLDSLDEITTVSYGFAIMNNPSLTNLDGLKSLDSVGNQFIFFKNNALTDITGLKNLTRVGELDIWYNDALTNLDGLENLESVNNLLSISGNPQLNRIDALQKIDTLGGLEIKNNPQLTNLHGLENLRFVGTSPAVTGTGLAISLNIEGHPLLTDLSGLDSLTTVVGGISITSNTNLSSLHGLNKLASAGGLNISYTNNLTDLSGLDNLTVIGNKWVAPYAGSLYIVENWGLLSLNGLGQLDSVGGKIIIESNPELPSLSGMPLLRRAGGLQVGGNHKLNSLAGLGELTELDSTLIIGGNALLTDLNGFPKLTRVGTWLYITDQPALHNLSGLEKLQTVGFLTVQSNEIMNSLSGLEQLRTIGGMFIDDNPALTNLHGLDSLETISGDLIVSRNPLLIDFTGLGRLDSIGGDFDVEDSPALTSFNGLERLKAIGKNLIVYQNSALTTLNGLNQLETVGGYLLISRDSALQNLQGLESLHTVGKEFFIVRNPALSSLSGLAQLQQIGGDGYPCYIEENHALLHLNGLEHLNTVTGELNIRNNASLLNLQGLNHLKSVLYNLRVEDNPSLQTLNGLDSLASVEAGNLEISNNDVLSDLSGLSNLAQAAGLLIQGNALLSDCAIFPVCNQILNNPALVTIFNNATDCNSTAEVETFCNSIPVLVTLRQDANGNCQPDAGDLPVTGAIVSLSGNAQMNLRSTDSLGIARFRYLESGAFSVSLPQFPTGSWSVCQEPVVLDPMGSGDTLRTTLLLSALVQCPELQVQLGLPVHFRGCLSESKVAVAVRNTGTAAAEILRIRLTLPAGLELVSATPPPAMQSGDTLFFETATLAPFASATFDLTVKTKCDVFLFGQTLCLEASVGADNLCPSTLPAFSEIKVSATCLADSVQFTLKNIGDAPTQAPHSYTVFRNETPSAAGSFALNSQQSLTLSVPADGATWRVEATKLDDGSLTATALENCGGLTPGLINAFWLETGPKEYDFACRQVIGSFDPNQKTAVPAGSGSQHLLAANRPLQYTIDFQNTGTDTAFRVLLRDDLNENLDVSTFQPGLASHPCTWEIRGRRLEVLFFPIALPDSNVNEPASHGFFNFEIGQKPDLPDGTALENTADIIFDFNPPILTNTVRHTIGQLVVRAYEPVFGEVLWQVLGNPTSGSAVFLAKKFIAGEKRFGLYDAAGRLIRQESFSGQAFEFQRNTLPGGLYFFKIGDPAGRVFSGKIIVSD